VNSCADRLASRYALDEACCIAAGTLLQERTWNAIAALKAHQAELMQLGVQALYLFGSTARGEAREDSDVDLFIDYQEGIFGLFDLMEVQERTSRILRRPADITTRDSIHKILRPRIEATVLRIF
jgi:predicted nucleotidyltransferase